MTTDRDTETANTAGSVIAIDVGGTSTKIAIADQDGNLTNVRRVPSPPSSPDNSAPAVVELARGAVAEALRSDNPPVALGITIPGVVAEDRGVGIHSANLGWRDVDFGALFRDAIDIPVAILHDVRAAGAAECRLGAAAGADTALVVAIGTGIAAAVVVDGQPRVAGGYAGEVGHAVVVPGGEPCVCGNRGCLEAIASAGAIARIYSRESGTTVPGAREVFELAANGNSVAIAVLDAAFDALALGLSQSICLLAPDVVVLGGGLAQAGDALITPVHERLIHLLKHVPCPPVVRAECGQDAALVGAALAAHDLVSGDHR